ncbi:MAG: PepSY domain-containing protein [Albidovulum sp.]
MKIIARMAACSAIALCIGVPAFADSDTAMDATTEQAVTTKLTAEGYEVRSVAMEGDLIEVYVLKDGKKQELFLDADLNVVKTN